MRRGAAIADEIVAEIDSALSFRVYPYEEIHEIFINIVDRANNGRVVTTLELLSHTNKTARNRGREVYLEKQQEILASHTNLIEIDLLRAGHHTVAVPLEAGLPDVGLDLQAVFAHDYEEGAYARKVDYAQEPVPPLSAEDTLWADKLLRECGLRSKISLLNTY